MFIFQVGVQRTRTGKAHALDEEVDNALETVKKIPEIAKATANQNKEDSLKTIFAKSDFREKFKSAFYNAGGDDREWAQLLIQYTNQESAKKQQEKLSMAMLRGMTIKRASDQNIKEGTSYAQAQMEKSKDESPFGAPKTDTNYG